MGGAAFGDILTQVQSGGSPWAVQLPSGWGQGRATFGGLVVALGLEAARGLVAPERRLRSMLASFAGPVAPGAAEVQASVLRAGRAVTQVQAEVRQEGKAACAILAAFGAGRASALSVAPEPRPDDPGPEGLMELPFIPGVIPDFFQHMSARWTVGGPPFSATRSPDMGGWCRFLPPAPAGSEAWLAGLMDLWPAPVLPYLSAPAPASSLTWSMELVEDVSDQPMDAWWLYRARVEGAAEGYAQFRANLWAPNGRLAAVSRQTVAVFA
jgi:acyl-CoA thioesterase